MENMRKPFRRKRITVKIVLIIAVISVLFGALFSVTFNLAEKYFFPRKYTQYVEKYAAEYGVPESVVYAVIKTESDFSPDATSYADPPALGLMQLTEETYIWVGKTLLRETIALSKIYDPETNIRYGTYLLSYLYRRFENWENTYAAYNAGMARVYGWLEDPEYSDGNGNLINIPFSETRAYVKKVEKYRLKYEKLYYNN